MSNIKNLTFDNILSWTTIQSDYRRPDAYAMFVNIFNVIPNFKTFNSFSDKDSEMNIVKFYENVIDFFTKNNIEYIQHACHPILIKDRFGDQVKAYYTSIGICYEKKLVIVAASSYVTVYFINECELISQIEALIRSCIEPRQLDKKVHLITQDASGYFDLTECKISQNTPLDINKHYNDDFKPEYDKITRFLSERKSGLCILHGVPGTGKTNLIRHFINTCPNQYIILSNSLMNAISNPGFISFMLENKDSVLILEDCEMLLEDRSSSRFSDGIANVLNMTDGLYSDILNIKIIATFNSDLTTIDRALLRDGRLISKYEFKELSIEKSNELLKEQNKPVLDKALTLSEIYNKSTEEVAQVKNKKRIGF